MATAVLINAISAHIAQRSGINWRDYNDRAAFLQDYRRIIRDGKHARRMLRAVELSSMTDETLLSATRGAFAGRMTAANGKLEYCTGQYFATEYRAAACAVLARALTLHYADGHCSKGREWARRNLGRGSILAWFE